MRAITGTGWAPVTITPERLERYTIRQIRVLCEHATGEPQGLMLPVAAVYETLLQSVVAQCIRDQVRPSEVLRNLEWDAGLPIAGMG